MNFKYLQGHFREVSLDHVRLVGRFFGVSLMGGMVDMLGGLLALNWLEWSLTASTCAGFFCGFLAGYLGHELWTFPSDKRFSFLRFGRYALVSAVLILGRILIVEMLQLIFTATSIPNVPLSRNILFICMLSLSFVLNFILCKHFAFARTQK